MNCYIFIIVRLDTLYYSTIQENSAKHLFELFRITLMIINICAPQQQLREPIQNIDKESNTEDLIPTVPLSINKQITHSINAFLSLAADAAFHMIYIRK